MLMKRNEDLPILYGLLGASAYVLRGITRAIQNLTYIVETNARYRLRIHLGSVQGLRQMCRNMSK